MFPSELSYLIYKINMVFLRIRTLILEKQEKLFRFLKLTSGIQEF